jgi:hypothetical protein
MVVEAVGDEIKTDEQSASCDGVRSSVERLSTQRVDGKIVEPAGPGRVFHFSEPPTVTTGFHAFVFDIRREQK